ncbi:MAG: hypothetical protein QG622_3750 [Actinomycetota bacterium]|nr:hypothetical protein [Actinomycetota bacterium]
MTDSVNLTSFGIHLKVADITRSRYFYELLGLVPHFGFGDEDFRTALPPGCGFSPEVYRGVIYKIGDSAELEIAEGHVSVKPEVFSERVSSPKCSAMLRVDSIVPVLATGGVEPIAPVRRYYWGSIELVLRDPDGFVVVVISPDSPGELDAVSRFGDVEWVPAPAGDGAAR